MFAIVPNAIETSSIEYSNEPATGATYLNDSPNISTFVFELDADFAKTSAKCVAFETSFSNPPLMILVVPSAAKPNAVIASVTISDVLAKSRPSAADNAIIPSIELSISSVSQPAMAI